MRSDRDDLERLSRSLSEREREVRAAEYKVLSLEAERDTLERRLHMLQRTPSMHKEAPRKGLDYDEAITLG